MTTVIFQVGDSSGKLFQMNNDLTSIQQMTVSWQQSSPLQSIDWYQPDRLVVSTIQHNKVRMVRVTGTTATQDGECTPGFPTYGISIEDTPLYAGLISVSVDQTKVNYIDSKWRLMGHFQMGQCVMPDNNVWQKQVPQGLQFTKYFQGKDDQRLALSATNKKLYIETDTEHILWLDHSSHAAHVTGYDVDHVTRRMILVFYDAFVMEYSLL